MLIGYEIDFLFERDEKRIRLLQFFNRIKITVHTLPFAERDVDVEAGTGGGHHGWGVVQ